MSLRRAREPATALSRYSEGRWVTLLITAKEEQICGLHHSQKWEGTFLSHQVPSSTSAWTTAVSQHNSTSVRNLGYEGWCLPGDGLRRSSLPSELASRAHWVPGRLLLGGGTRTKQSTQVPDGIFIVFCVFENTWTLDFTSTTPFPVTWLVSGVQRG